MTGSSIAALIATMFVLAVVPGPSDFAVVARSIAAGFGQGLITISGIVAADLLFIVLAVYGLAEVADWLGGLFAVVKYACGAYLIWLGIASLRSRPTETDLPELRSSKGYSSFLAGLTITLGDPKAILFYMGLFPAFVDLAHVSIADTLTIMLVAILLVGGVKTSYAYLAHRAKRLFANIRLRRRLDRLAGGILIVTGLFILFSR